jgi:cytochrome P450
MNTTEVKVPKIGLLHNLLNIRSIARNPALYFNNILNANNGLVMMHVPMGKIYLTDRPALMRHVLQQNNRNYTKSWVVRKMVRQQAGNGLLTSEGDYWLQQRRAIQPGFHRKRLEGISKIMVEEINQYLNEVMDAYAENEQVIDLEHEMKRLAFKVVSKSLFGEAVDDERLNAIDEIVSYSQQFIVNRVRKPFLKPWYYLKGDYAKASKMKEQGDALILEIIRERQASGKKQDDLLDMLLETRYEDGTGMNEQQLLDEALILYVAGHETSAMAMSWAWYLICAHPEVEQKLLQSVKDNLGVNAPSFEQLRNLGYALQVVEETMRLYPPAWLVDREALEDDEFEGVKIKKGQGVNCLIYSAHHNEKYWNNPEQFDPERFNPENKAKQLPYSYMPFGGGPRLCIGNNFALMEMQFVLAMMVRRYTFELVPNQQIEMNPLITLRPRYGIKVKVRKRK